MPDVSKKKSLYFLLQPRQKNGGKKHLAILLPTGHLEFIPVAGALPFCQRFGSLGIASSSANSFLGGISRTRLGDKGIFKMPWLRSFGDQMGYLVAT
jgi:hypothetical protein